jgi:hypothetical protein
VKRLCADDSAATSVKVGYRQASYKRKPDRMPGRVFLFLKGLISPDALEIALGAGGAFCFMESRR